VFLFLCVSVFLICAVLLMGQVPEIKWIGLDWVSPKTRESGQNKPNVAGKTQGWQHCSAAVDASTEWDASRDCSVLGHITHSS